jgi:hypothetical protein
MALGEDFCLAAAPEERSQPDVTLPLQRGAPSRRSAPEQRLTVAVIRQRTIKWRWLLCLVIISCPQTTPADENGSRGRANNWAIGVEEHARGWPPQSISILNATGSGSEPDRPNYRVIGRSLGFPEQIASLLDDFSSMNDGRVLEKPQKLLATYLLSQAVGQVPFLASLRDRVPHGVKLKIDIGTRGVAVQIAVPLPALDW